MTLAATALLALAPAAPALADSLLVQPDGKIVLAGGTSPEFGALARLLPDGTLDPGFGQGGFMIDQRPTGFQEVALQPDGRIVGAFAPGSMLARYLPDGSPDPSFAGGGLGGTYEPDQPSYSGVSALLVQPGGGIVVAGETGWGGEPETWVRRYDAAGALLETAGRVPPQGAAISSAGFDDLVERPDGSFIGGGWADSEDIDFPKRPLLARFLPGSGLGFDPSFGGGAGLVQPSFPATRDSSLYRRGFRALAQTGDKVLAAGASRRTFLLARFDAGGNLDPSFGEGGFVLPPIVGPGAKLSKGGGGEEASSWAEDVAVVPDGDVVLGGGTSQWSTEWMASKAFPFHCRDCPQPLLARFDASGRLDSSFGRGGLLRLLEPDGSGMQGGVQQVTALADGKILVSGSIFAGLSVGEPFVARLNPDGSYDPGFGDKGLLMLRFPCSNQGSKELRRTGCTPSALLTSRLRGLRRGRPALSLQVAPNLPWAAISQVTLILPRGVRLAKRFKSRVRMTAVGGTKRHGRVGAYEPGRRERTRVFFSSFGEARELRIKLQGGSLQTFGRQRRALRLQVEVTFVDTTIRDLFESHHTIERRVRSNG